MEALSWSLIAAAVVATVGVVQWVKGFFPESPTWPWRVLMPLVAVAWGLALGGSWVARAIYAALIISLSEAGYKVVVQKLSEVAGNLVDKLR